MCTINVESQCDINILYKEVCSIFENVVQNPSTSINKYLCWQILVVFADKTLFVYEPFECFKVRDYYYNKLKTTDVSNIKTIVIFNKTKDHITTNLSNFNVSAFCETNMSLQCFAWNTFCTENYRDMDFLINKDDTIY